MQFEAIRLPQVAYPVQGTDSGTPVLTRPSIPFGAVMPPPILPDDNAKTRERNPDPQKTPRGEPDDAPAQSALPEPFKLIFAKDLAEFLRYLSVENHQWLFQTAQRIKAERGAFAFKGYPPYFIETPVKADSICLQYEAAVFFHETRPGDRFSGKL